MATPRHTNASVVGTEASRRHQTNLTPCRTEGCAVSCTQDPSTEYPEPSRAATHQLVVYTSVRVDVFGRRTVRAVALPLPAAIGVPADTLTYRGATWSRLPETAR